MKRVCGSLLTQREPVPHYAVVAAATNHRQMFDRATWRCFEVRPELRSPDDARLHLYIRGGLGDAFGANAGRERARTVRSAHLSGK